MTEAKVFTDKLEALRHFRGSEGKFFETWHVPEDHGMETLYVVAVSEHQAKLALAVFLMPLKKWDRKTIDREYIAALEAEAAKNQDES